MKFQFESNLEHQNRAIKSVINIFNGIQTRDGIFSIRQIQKVLLENNQTKGISNIIKTYNWIGEIAQENVHNIQVENGLFKSKINPNFPTFDIEMETGTGKTYVFLKTILELNQNYDFKKFIIVVPSVAIKEGILKTLQITKEHFSNLYPSIKYYYYEYDGQSLQTVWNFANNNSVEIMIVTIQAINKNINIFHKNQENLSGNKPQELIKNTNPIIIIDEPQSTTSTEKSIQIIHDLNPLFILRYSATFKERKHENLIYRLDAFDAYKKRLVKEIQVYGTQIENNSIRSYVKLVSLDIKKQKVEIEIKVANKKNGISIKKKKVITNDDLYNVSNQLNEYENLKIENINFKDKLIELSDGREIALGANNDEYDLFIKTTQIRETIETHLKRQFKLKEKGIKVLSLFFIDKVSKYRIYDENGKQSLGEYAEIFEKEFIKFMTTSSGKKYHSLFPKSDIQNIQKLASKIHDGYFSVDKKNNFKDTKGDSKDDTTTYDKIMKDKEKLISFDEPLCFIFSHSTLKEGWDNPNVFQICTLNDTKSEIKKRQEIGRGLRLCVNQNGLRVYDESVNILSVFTNESYENFVKSLQEEMKEEGILFEKIEIYSFSNEIEQIDKKTSEEIYKLLIDNNFINRKGKLTKDYHQDKIKNLLSEKNIVDEKNIDNVILVIESYKKVLNINDGRKTITNTIKKEVIESEEFQKLWNTINTKTIYNVKFDTEEFINKTKKNILKNLDNINSATIVVTKAEIDIKRSGVESKNIGIHQNKRIDNSSIGIQLIDIVSDIEKTTGLTRKTIVKIISEEEIIEAIRKNQESAKKIINKAMNEEKIKLMVDGIEYQKINEYYEQKLLNENIKEFNKENNNFYIDASNSNKYPYKFIITDSNIENKFGNDSLKANIIKKFIKLPNWFTINTPLGTYNPDWALYHDSEVIFVAETKGTNDLSKLRNDEQLKIQCGKKHFQALGKIEYHSTTSLKNLISNTKELEK